MKITADNLRRLMAKMDLTLDDVVAATGVCERTVKQVLRGRSKPQARTLYRLAKGLGVSVDEFFWSHVETHVVSRFTDEQIRLSIEQLIASERREVLAEIVAALCDQESILRLTHAPDQRWAGSTSWRVRPVHR